MDCIKWSFDETITIPIEKLYRSSFLLIFDLHKFYTIHLDLNAPRRIIYQMQTRLRESIRHESIPRGKSNEDVEIVK